MDIPNIAPRPHSSPDSTPQPPRQSLPAIKIICPHQVDHVTHIGTIKSTQDKHLYYATAKVSMISLGVEIAWNLVQKQEKQS